jgi:hypothetical protein
MASKPTPSPQGQDDFYGDSSNSPLFIFDGPGDNTRRPARPNLPPPYWPGPPPKDEPPQQDKN